MVFSNIAMAAHLFEMPHREQPAERFLHVAARPVLVLGEGVHRAVEIAGHHHLQIVAVNR